MRVALATCCHVFRHFYVTQENTLAFVGQKRLWVLLEGIPHVGVCITFFSGADSGNFDVRTRSVKESQMQKLLFWSHVFLWVA